MNLSIYDAVIQMFHKSAKEMVDYLHRKNITVFDSLFIPLVPPEGGWPEDYTPPERFSGNDLKVIILYIVYAYSEQSEWLVLGANSLEEKEAIAERLQMPEYLRGKTIHLKSKTISDVIVKYLDKQYSRAFHHLKLKQIYYEAALSNGVSSLSDEEGKVDVKAMKAISDHANQLLEDIKALEKELRSEFKYRFDNIEEIEEMKRYDGKTGNDGGSVENSQWIK